MKTTQSVGNINADLILVLTSTIIITSLPFTRHHCINQPHVFQQPNFSLTYLVPAPNKNNSMDSAKKGDFKQTAYVDYKAIGCKFPGGSSSKKYSNTTHNNHHHHHHHNHHNNSTTTTTTTTHNNNSKPDRLSGKFNNKHDSSRTTPSSTVTTPTSTTKTPTSSYYAGPKFLSPPLPSMLPMPPTSWLKKSNEQRSRQRNAWSKKKRKRKKIINIKYFYICNKITWASR